MAKAQPGDNEKWIKLLALAMMRDLPSKERMLLMNRAGFGGSEIADLLGTTTNAVNARLSEMRATERKAQAAPRGKAKLNEA